LFPQDSTKEPKKKKKKKKKANNTPKEEEVTEEKTVEVQQEEQPELPLMPSEKQDELETKQPETSAMNEDSEHDEDVFQPDAEVSTDARASHPSATIPREGDDFKGNISSLLSDEWQPRRSERIFINSSVTSISSPSPLSPVGKGNEFSYTKKAKKGPGTKVASVSCEFVHIT